MPGGRSCRPIPSGSRRLVGAHPRQILTVSELTLLVRDRLEQSFPDIWVEGEVSNLRTPSSGHLYFTLKDRSEERRVGKECRSWWSRYHEKKDIKIEIW